MIAKIDGTVLPITVTDFHEDNTYTCSPYTHYISYGGFEEVRRLKNPALETPIKILLMPLARYFRDNEFDRVVYVNNWLLSTNLYPAMTEGQIKALAETLPDRFPDRAIVFRSVDDLANPIVQSVLRNCGYEMILSRQVWYQNPETSLHKKQFKVDQGLLRRSPYEVVDGEEFTDDDIARSIDLYNLLYLSKYSRYNPQFSAAFLKMARDRELLCLTGLRRAHQLHGVLGYFMRNGIMTQPLFGYDTRLPQSEGLYPILSLLTLQEGLSRKLLVHASAGVGKFKKLRGGRSVIEYNAVYYRHLHGSRKTPWKVLKKITDRAIPVFQKNDF
jgi:hypothetical protein